MSLQEKNHLSPESTDESHRMVSLGSAVLCVPVRRTEHKEQTVASPGFPRSRGGLLRLQEEGAVSRKRREGRLGRGRHQMSTSRQLVNMLSCQQMCVQLKDNSAFSLGTK